MTKKTETINGVPVTEEMIQAWADEAEAGYDPTDIKEARRGRPTMGVGPAKPISVRLDPEPLSLVAAKAERLHIKQSDVIRDAIRKDLLAS